MCFVFFFQAEDGIRDWSVTGVQTCALPILIRDGLWCSFCDVHMGGHAEYTANKAGVTRQQLDEFAVSSHRKAVAAIEAGKFREEIVPVEIAGRKGPTVVDTDEGPRADT